MNSLYFDYNSTAPLAKSVKAYLAKGVFFEANPSAAHYLGKKALKLINETSNTIKDLFSLKSHRVVYTTGATEGLNWIVSSFALEHKDSDFLFICFQTDHSVALEQEEYVQKMGGKFFALPVLSNGQPDLDQLQKTLSDNSGKDILLNWTWVNNETGVVWDLDLISKLKTEYSFTVHVDAPQSLFKLKNFNKLRADLEMYSYSGHKFGALKGVGFSLLQNNLKLKAMLRGGAQQINRSGTMNTLAIYSMHLAFNDHLKTFKPDKQQKCIDYLRGELATVGTVLGGGSLNLNTINIALTKTKSQLALIKFDLAQIAISSGSACQSGTHKPSHVIQAMGYNELAEKTLRFSFGFDLTMDKAKEYLDRIKKVVKELEN